MNLLQKLSGFAKTFRSALLTRWRGFCDSACPMSIFMIIWNNFWYLFIVSPSHTRSVAWPCFHSPQGSWRWSRLRWWSWSRGWMCRPHTSASATSSPTSEEEHETIVIAFVPNSLTASPIRTILKMKSNLQTNVPFTLIKHWLWAPCGLFQGILTLLSYFWSQVTLQGGTQTQGGAGKTGKPLFCFAHLRVDVSGKICNKPD